MKVATWNVNSIRARLPNVLTWLNENPLDVLLLQEIKCVDDNFPFSEFENIGYNVLVNGQKAYNGVAILSRSIPETVIYNLPGNDQDIQRRYIEARIEGVVFGCIYLPNGNPINTEKFSYKLHWMEKLRQHAQNLLMKEVPVILGGDFNIIPTDDDVHDPLTWKDDALCLYEARQKFREIINLGYMDAFRIFNTNANNYTFWDYQGGAWQNDYGVRIDHFLLSAQAADICTLCEIDSSPRGRPKASDHTPICIELHQQ
jgi:exodeoxyribonuclease-3